MKPYFFIFGSGYTAQALAPKLIAQGYEIIGTSRTPAKHNWDIKLIDFDCPNIESYLSLATHLLISIPPNTLSDIVLSKYGDCIKKHSSSFRWLGYLSSTGVYGNHEGNWVNEESKCMPHTPTGTTRLKAEQAWISFAQRHQLPLHIFRLSGIYGPGRNVLERLMHGKTQSILKENQVFCRIHIEDIVTTLLASMQLPNPLSIYNVSDDEPAPTHVVDLYGANLLNQKPLLVIPFSEAHLSPTMKEFYANNRRVANLKIKKELHVALKYPTFREGLIQIWNKDYAQR